MALASDARCDVVLASPVNGGSVAGLAQLAVVEADDLAAAVRPAPRARRAVPGAYGWPSSLRDDPLELERGLAELHAAIQAGEQPYGPFAPV